jgi:large subunit ribosomal protein L29
MTIKLKQKETLNSKDINELFADLQNLKKELFSSRYNISTNELKDVSLLKKCKKNIARVKTLISQKMRGVSND